MQVASGPSPSSYDQSTYSDHLNPFISKIDKCTGELNSLRCQIEECLDRNQPVQQDLKKQTYECMSLLRQLQFSMKQHNAAHRESKRVVRRTPNETKYTETKTQPFSTAALPKRSNSGWFKSSQVNAIQNRLNTRVRRAWGRLQTKEKTSPV